METETIFNADYLIIIMMLSESANLKSLPVSWRPSQFK